MKEIWKTIEDFDAYEISNKGKVKSLKLYFNKILKAGISRGYFHVTLSNDSIQKQFTIHRLVAQAFLPNSDHKPQVNHIDGNKLNNCVDNLEWVTSSENHLHAFKNNLRNHKGENHPLSKLMDMDVLTIHGLYLSGMNQLTISKLYGISRQLISIIVIGKSWKHLL